MNIFLGVLDGSIKCVGSWWEKRVCAGGEIEPKKLMLPRTRAGGFFIECVRERERARELYSFRGINQYLRRGRRVLPVWNNN